MAKVDGRNAPLTVGYHKVTVDIRDQIARTVIEESFVNHTDGRLEGVFYFPLPQDASISGFGMWIGDELVEADVVEKQRAREIYETILRERRDPGLLEWSGGNIFKARVFPIEPHSEKRIKITYTQVLPLQGNAYRYSYALQSEMLKQHPLRELAIDVKLNSAVPLAERHLARRTPRGSTRRAHSAHVEFAAQEYTPTRDFEVVVEVDGRQSDVVLIPHRRGDDGYFMLHAHAARQADSATRTQRELLPDGEPLDLLDPGRHVGLDGRRRPQGAGRVHRRAACARSRPRTRFNLAVLRRRVRLGLREVRGRPTPRTSTPRGSSWPTASRSAGPTWTRRCRRPSRSAGPKTRVIYVGDGIPTDRRRRSRGLRQAACKRLWARASRRHVLRRVGRQQLRAGRLEGHRLAGRRLGAADQRRAGPAAVARELLGEIARPAVRDLKVEFRGLRTARVYPGELPNLAAGTSRSSWAAICPKARDQAGEVIVTGTRAASRCGSPRSVSLKDAEQGNSFIPRLWARMHLDTLLQQGASQAIQDEIIALSEEYHIMTPYTSLLVLESDADRERFKVKRRFQMRDGEKFFAAGARQRQLRTGAAADEAGRHVAAGPAAGRACSSSPAWAATRGCSSRSKSTATTTAATAVRSTETGVAAA